MWVTQREATRRMAGNGYGYGESCRVLEAGLAGEPVRTAAALLYDAAKIEALCTRDLVERPFPSPCDTGIFVLRGSLEGLERAHRLHFAYRVGAYLRLQQQGWLPLVTTLSGFVTGTRAITGMYREGDGLVHLETSVAGDWRHAFEGRLLPLGRGPSLQWHGRAPWEGLDKR